MPQDYQPTPRELYDLVLTLKDATELGFARVDGRLDRVELRVDRVEGRLTGVEGRLSGVERWMTRIDDRLASIEAQNVTARLNDHDQRIRKLEQRP